MGKFIVVALVAIVFVVALSGGDGTSAAAHSPAPAAGSATPSAYLSGGVLYPSQPQPAGQMLHSFTWEDARYALALVGIDINASSYSCIQYNEPGHTETRYSQCAVRAPDGRSGTLYMRDGVLTAGQ